MMQHNLGETGPVVFKYHSEQLSPARLGATDAGLHVNELNTTQYIRRKRTEVFCEYFDCRSVCPAVGILCSIKAAIHAHTNRSYLNDGQSC